MHELAITKYLLAQILEEARKNNAAHISGISLVLGELSGYVSESIQFYWDIIAKGSIAEKAKITYTYKEVTWQCQKCDQIFTAPTKDSRCPFCQSSQIKINGGGECLIESIEF